MARHPKTRRAQLLHPLASAILLALATTAVQAQNIPVEDTSVGRVGISDVVPRLPGADGFTGGLTIFQNEQNAILHWETFSIGEGYLVHFDQPNSNSIALNRVTGGEMSQIMGSLTATGHVFLVNPNGILFGGDSVVDVGGLVASTLGISDDDFSAGAERGSFAFTDGGWGSVDVQEGASLTARGLGGTIALLGSSVENAGRITANGGSVLLGAGQQLTLDIGGDQLTMLRITGDEGGEFSAANVASGVLQADGGMVGMHVGGASGRIDQAGSMIARSLQATEGRIVLAGADAAVALGGSIDASAQQQGAAGGSIDVNGSRVWMEDGTSINAGGSGGGNGELSIISQATVRIATQGRIENDPDTDYSYLADSAIGQALANGTDVSISAVGHTDGEFGPSRGDVEFLADEVGGGPYADQAQMVGAAIRPPSGGAARLVFNARRDIHADHLVIEAGAGALDVDFNANAGDGAAGSGTIELSGSTIRSNGGSVRLYGQNDPDDGWAAGDPYVADGIRILDSLIDTCGFAGGDACGASAGAIILRGSGGEPFTASGTAMGVNVLGSTLRTHSGAITVAGHGSPGAGGVLIGQAMDDDGPVGDRSSLQTVAGNIDIAGTAGDAGDYVFWTPFTSLAGVSIDNADISAGGDVRIQGHGASLEGLVGFAPSTTDGILVRGNIRAGRGRALTLTGTAGAPMDGGPDGRAIAIEGGTLSAPGGGIELRSDPGVSRFSDTVIITDGGALDVSSPGGVGGSILVRADAMLVDSGTSLDASGANGGGVIDLETEGVLALGATGRIAADAQAAGSGGSIRLFGGDGLRAFGALSARGAGRGNGGDIETSGGGLDLRGIDIDASAPGGVAGSWLIDPYDVYIVHGDGDSALPVDGVFNPISDATIQDGDINNALNAGTSVQITTGLPGTGDSAGDIVFLATEGLVQIERTLGDAALSLRFDAHGGIYTEEHVNGSTIEGFTIDGGAGPLNVLFNVDANAAVDSWGEVGLTNANIFSRGGDVRFFGQSNEVGGFTHGVTLRGSNIDTGQVAGTGGELRMRGHSSGTGIQIGDSDLATGGGGMYLSGVGSDGYGIEIYGSDLATEGGAFQASGTSADWETGIGIQESTVITAGGSLDVTGIGGEFGSGVNIDGSTLASQAGNLRVSGRSQTVGVEVYSSTLATTSGDLDVFGSTDISGSDGGGMGVWLTGSSAGPQRTLLRSQGGQVRVSGIAEVNDAFVYWWEPTGVWIEHASVENDGGTIDILGRGTGFADGSDGTHTVGVFLGEAAVVGSASSTRVRLVGEAAGDGGDQTGLLFADDNACGVAGGACVNGVDVILQAASGAGPAIDFRGGGHVAATRVINLRPGGVDADGIAYERPGDDITIGGDAGFAFGQDVIARMQAPELVIGSNIQTGGIEVLQAVARPGNLTLQADGAGADGIWLEAGINVDGRTLALSSSGDIAQIASAPLVAESLLARSTAGDVLLASAANNVAGTTLAGSAAGDFSYHDVDGLSIGSVDAIGFNATGDAPQPLSATGVVAGDDVFIQNLDGDLVLGADIGAGNNITLVTAGRLQNSGGATLTAGNQWQVWANTWIGETRGGLAGSGPLPNLYNCTADDCGPSASISATDNQFIYAQQPTATITLDSHTREYGLDNPAFGYAIDGIILDDIAGNVIAGDPVTAATMESDVGAYAIAGDFSSAAGYAIAYQPGTLDITPATLLYVADPYSRIYGAPEGTLTGTVEGFRNADTLADSTTGTLVFTSGTDVTTAVGTYAITGGGLDAHNYVFEQAPGNATAYEITPAMLLLYVANPYSRVYGDPQEGALTGTVEGFLNGDTLASSTTGTLVFTSGTDVTTAVGTYAITGSGLESQNYVFAQAPGNATAYEITPATLVYVANPYSRVYGDPEGTLTGTVEGFRNADTLTGATTGTLVFTSGTDVTTAVGSYAISGSGLDAHNYVFEQATGNASAYEITPATLLYVANPYTRVYGDPEGTLIGTVDGFRNADTLTGATTGTLVFTSGTDVTTAVGSYAITGGGLESQNYVFAQAPGNAAAYEITPATLLYVATPYTRIYGDPEGTLTGTVEGFRNADTLADSTTGALAFTSGTDVTTAVGSYAISGSGLDAHNYVFEQAPGNAAAYDITPATLLYVANPFSRLVGQPNGVLGGTVEGLRNGDTLADATTGALEFSSPAQTLSPVGTYAIDGSGLQADNYVFEQAPGNASALTVFGTVASLSPLDLVREPQDNYLYDRNIGAAPMCPILADSMQLAQSGDDDDVLGREWSRVKSRPNLSSCVQGSRRNGCDDF